MKKFSQLFLKFLGWKVKGTLPEEDKCIVIAAPHTSNWDFFYGWLFYTSLGGKAQIMIKENVFVFPLSILLRWMGAIPVDRRPGNKMIEKLALEFKKSDRLHLAIAPEGTRSKVTTWKKGFLVIARRANVPIYLAYADYKKKELGLLGKYYATENHDLDLKEIKHRYEGITPKHPNQFTAN
jgi:1-acyl-sn-glycerol-3-phosphate acyltransferase